MAAIIGKVDVKKERKQRKLRYFKERAQKPFTASIGDSISLDVYLRLQQAKRTK